MSDTTASSAVSDDPVSDDPVGVIRAWLADRVGEYLERPAAEIDPDTELVELGLDSVYALTLAGDMEDRFGLVLDTTLVWDYPTINALAGYLAAELTSP